MELFAGNNNPGLPQNHRQDTVISQTRAFFENLDQMLKEKKVEVSKPALSLCNRLQCMYALNLKTREVVSSSGVEDMLGYKPEEFTFGNLVNFIHPDDVDVLTSVIYAVVEYASHHQSVGDLTLSVSYRVRKKNGNYIKVLRQTTVSRHPYEPQVIYHNNVLTDISFMRSGTAVEWTFDAPGFNPDTVKMYVPQNNTRFFSTRELEVLELIDKGYTSQAIAKALFISKHTVDTHRRKMLQKTGCPNAIALLEFYRSQAL